MKLRTKFIILVLGILVFPFLVSALLFFVQTIRSGKELPITHLKGFQQWISVNEDSVQLEAMLNFLLQKKQKVIEILIIDKDNRVLQSTFSDIKQPANINQERLLTYIREKAADYHFLLNVFPVLNPDNTVILKVKKINSLEEKIHKRTLILLEIVLFFYLAASLLSILIIRSFTRSIFQLKAATRKIAAGDLDFSLKAKGKDEIADLTRAFDSMRRSLKDEYGRRSRFLMGVSHDLKTPLALIEGYVEAIIDGHADDPGKLSHFLSIIQDKAKLLENRISDLIEYVKLATGEWKMIHKNILAADFLRKIANHYEKDARVLKRLFTYQITLPEKLVISMDDRLVERVLENIIANAIRYTAETDQICLTAALKERKLVITINDTGPGIASDDLGRIFDPFYRGSNSRQEGGMGLGLSTARSIIQAHGWSLDVSSTPGKGATFTISIPLG